MGRFNLIDEPWVSVLVDEKGTSKEVSLRDLFNNAHNYKGLAGDTVTQDFAVFRVILAIMHTVFSRFNADGKAYGYFELDERYRQKEIIEDENEADEYLEELYETWTTLWENGKFPPIINEYLDKWYDRFYLFDEAYPFFQVRKEDISAEKISKKNASTVSGKNINRMISESGNKLALFSPKHNIGKNKEILCESEIIRWLITFQGYSGLADKVIFGKDKYKASKGWIYDIGGIVLVGKSLFESLMFNCVLKHTESKYRNVIEKPCWESNSNECIDRLFSEKEVDNLAELYTNWSRAIYIDPNRDPKKPFFFEIVKLPEISHQDNFIELMTIWKYNESGENKDKFTPRKHQINKSLWRSFGLLTLSYNQDSGGKTPQRKPGIMDWLNEVSEDIGEKEIAIQAISMKDDGNATSWVPTDEVIDMLNINDLIVTDIAEGGWVPRINDSIEETKKAVDETYKIFISEIKTIRNIKSKEFINQKVEELYFEIDYPFREWLSTIKVKDSKDKKVFEWRKILKTIILKEADKILAEAGPRDYMGIVKDEKIKNIATAYNVFYKFLNVLLKTKEEDCGEN